MLVQGGDQLRAILDHLNVAITGLWDGATVRLYQNDFVPVVTQVFADFTEATFTGYAASTAIVFPGALLNLLGQAQITGDTKQFASTGPAVGNTIFGYMVFDGAGTGVLWAERFAVSIGVNDVGDGVEVVPRYALGQLPT